jgi:hypothetical protein
MNRSPATRINAKHARKLLSPQALLRHIELFLYGFLSPVGGVPTPPICHRPLGIATPLSGDHVARRLHLLAGKEVSSVHNFQ